MATSNVSAIDQDIWQLISTNTASAASTSTFSSISGYKTLMLQYKMYTTTNANPVKANFNSDTTQGNYVSVNDWGSNGIEVDDASILLGRYPYTSVARTGYIIINNVNQSCPHEITGVAYDGHIEGMYLQANAITSITITPRTSGTFTGTFFLYGIAG